MPGAPGAFSLVTPADSATVSTSPTFTWGAANGATNYRIQIATDTGFSSLVVHEPGIAGTTFTPAAPLNPTTPYYWRVFAENSFGSTLSTETSRTFTTS